MDVLEKWLEQRSRKGVASVGLKGREKQLIGPNGYANGLTTPSSAPGSTPRSSTPSTGTPSFGSWFHSKQLHSKNCLVVAICKGVESSGASSSAGEQKKKKRRWPGVMMDFRDEKFHQISVLLVLDCKMKMLTLTVDM